MSANGKQNTPKSMSSHQRARLTLFIALFLLILSGVAASVVIIRLYLSESWVRHTYAVEVTLGDLESALALVGGDRLAYLNAPTDKLLRDFQVARQQVPPLIAQIRSLTSDSPNERLLCDQLEENAKRRMAPSIQSVELFQRGSSNSMEQIELTAEVGAQAIQTAAIAQQMRRNEDELLAQRGRLRNVLFGATAAILAVSFLLSAVMFLIHNRMLQRELGEREAAERQMRELSVQLLRVRDEEARRFARELHDGVGQTMVAAQILAQQLQSANPANEQIQELAKLVEEVAAQTRTISYLLHPPMLDELGFAPAAEWFVQGFSRRTGIAVTTHILLDGEKLPKNLETALFRVLQEALTNIHRHSGSRSAEVSLSKKAREVQLVVRDHGRGISKETLSNFENNGTHVGVGLAGMKERVTEFNGVLEVRSNRGTTIIARMPVGAAQPAPLTPVTSV